MPKIDISKLSPEDILDLQNQLAKQSKQLSKAKKSLLKPKRVIPDDVDWDPFAMTPEAKAAADKFDSDLKHKKQREQKIKRSNKALTEARIKSADEYQRSQNETRNTKN